MKIHKEGFGILAVSAIICISLSILIQYFGNSYLPIWLIWCLQAFFIFIWLIILQFFRIPSRSRTYLSNEIVCPADGKVVVIEEVYEPEYLKTNCIQVSIFMSPLNVHANISPIAGKVIYSKYHPGSFLVAWHPKSSTENERTTMVLENINQQKVLVRQIAGALAKRICFYGKEGMEFRQGEEFGFIKFGSRVDLFLPLHSKINVNLNDTVKNKISIIGTI